MTFQQKDCAMFHHFRKSALRFFTLVLALLTFVAPLSAQDRPSLSIIWFAWPPCDLLTSLVADYPDADVTVTCVPIGEWRNQIFADFAAQGGADLPILDSQFMGEAVQGGFVEDLTEFLQSELPFDDYNQTALSYYAEVPLGSGAYYSVPVITDTRMLVYRRDLFEDADVQAAYAEATGSELQVPQSWTELLAIAQFLKDSEFIDAGYVSHWLNDGDLVQTAWNHILWSFGGELWDSETYTVEGVLNDEAGLEALTFAQELFLTGPEGAAAFGFDQVVNAVCSGSTAMIEIWYGFGGAFTNSETCPEAENLGFAVVPGEDVHFISLGGQGISVSAFSQNKDAARAFITWLQSDEIQTRWVQGGAFSGRNSILASEEFLNAAPYNPTFAEAFAFVKDFWNLPEYAEMLSVQGEYLNLAISGQMDAQEALDEIAAEQQEILDEAYPDGPPVG
jgi:multiple sugar transport system substrate-binding protein